MEPQIKLKHVKAGDQPDKGDPVTVEAVCGLPGVDPDASSMVLHVEHKRHYYYVPSWDGYVPRQVDTPTHPGSSGHRWLAPSLVKPIQDEQSGRLRGVKVRYGSHKVVGSKYDQFFGFLTHTTPQGFDIPAPDDETNKAADTAGKRNYVTARLDV